MKFLKIGYYLVFAFIGLIAILLVVSTFPITGNIAVKIVQSGSMEPSIKTGGIVIIKPVDNYKIGDVITFSKGKTEDPITHRIYEMRTSEGNPYYITKGDANDTPDQREVPKNEVLGKVLVSVPYLGYAVNFAQKPIGFALIIIVPAFLIVLDEVKKIIKEMKKRKNNS